MNLNDAFKISEGSVFEYRLDGDSAKHFELQQRVSSLGEINIKSRAEVRSLDSQEFVYMNLDTPSGFYRGKIDTDYKFEEIYQHKSECISFDAKRLPDSSILLAAICNEFDRDMLFLSKIDNKSVQESGKMEIEHDFDYLELYPIPSDSSKRALFLFDDRQERLDVFISESLIFTRIKSVRSKNLIDGLISSLDFRVLRDRKRIILDL